MGDSSCFLFASMVAELEFQQKEKMDLGLHSICSVMVIWSIWKMRNEWIFQNKQLNWMELVDLFKVRVALWGKSKRDPNTYSTNDFHLQIEECFGSFIMGLFCDPLQGLGLWVLLARMGWILEGFWVCSLFLKVSQWARLMSASILWVLSRGLIFAISVFGWCFLSLSLSVSGLCLFLGVRLYCLVGCFVCSCILFLGCGCSLLLVSGHF